MAEATMDKIVSLCKRRGFIFQSSEIYGGLAGSWDYGPLVVQLKNNIRDFWWKEMTQMHDNIVGLDAAIFNASENLGSKVTYKEFPTLLSTVSIVKVVSELIKLILTQLVQIVEQKTLLLNHATLI